jgi:glucose-1-phosphate adenylyltransferase
MTPVDNCLRESGLFAYPVESRFIGQLTRETFALVLAGGRGSRLKQLTDYRAKPAVPFGGKFRIIDFTLSNCVNAGVRRIGVATQYKAQSLIRHLQRGWSFLDGRFGEFIEILPAQQQLDDEKWYQGTADAVYQNLGVIKRDAPRFVIVLSGDHIYKMDYGLMLADHVAKQADLTVACIDVPIAEASAFGVMSVDATGRIREFAEKPDVAESIPGKPGMALASMGIYVFNTDFLFEQLQRDALAPTSKHDFGKDVIPNAMSRHRVFAHSFRDSCVGARDAAAPYWRDVGALDAYWDANIELTKVVPELDLYDQRWPIWTDQPQLPPAKFVFDDDGRRGIAVDAMVAGGCVVSGATVRRSLLFSDVHVEIGSSIEDSVILPNVKIGRNVTLKRVIVDRRSVIPEGLQVGVDRAIDRKRFHVSEGGVTLVTPEMLGQLVHRPR